MEDLGGGYVTSLYNPATFETLECKSHATCSAANRHNIYFVGCAHQEERLCNSWNRFCWFGPTFCGMFTMCYCEKLWVRFSGSSSWICSQYSLAHFWGTGMHSHANCSAANRHAYLLTPPIMKRLWKFYCFFALVNLHHVVTKKIIPAWLIQSSFVKKEAAKVLRNFFVQHHHFNTKCSSKLQKHSRIL